MSEIKNCYPHIHFAPKFGWMNDPNGMVFHDGVYELYYQCNPDSVEWDNMTWGHARSKDLYHWQQLDAVMHPDETGAMFSGSALINDKGLLNLPRSAILFPYTAAHVEKGFTIRMAVSTDGGNTLEKLPGVLLDSRNMDNRDPKVFWHEETNAYICVLWIRGNEFGIFRSYDLKYFELASLINLPFGFECPDFVRLPVINEETGEEEGRKWLFWTADSTYYVGDFDGYHFHPLETPFRRRGYIGEVPYAAQSFAGLEDTISISWLRTKTVCRQTTGAAGLPRKLTLVKKKGMYILRQEVVSQIMDAVVPVGEVSGEGGCLSIAEDTAVSFDFKTEGVFSVDFTDTEGNTLFTMSHEEGSRNLQFTREDVTEIFGIMSVQDFNMIYDRGILEFTADNATLIGVLDFAALRTKVLAGIKITCGKVSVSAGIIK